MLAPALRRCMPVASRGYHTIAPGNIQAAETPVKVYQAVEYDSKPNSRSNTDLDFIAKKKIKFIKDRRDRAEFKEERTELAYARKEAAAEAKAKAKAAGYTFIGGAA